jgi:hypothetical protein
MSSCTKQKNTNKVPFDNVLGELAVFIMLFSHTIAEGFELDRQLLFVDKDSV